MAWTRWPREDLSSRPYVWIRRAGTHGDVLNLHTEFFSACQAAPHTTPHTQHNTTHNHSSLGIHDIKNELHTFRVLLERRRSPWRCSVSSDETSKIPPFL